MVRVPSRQRTSLTHKTHTIYDGPALCARGLSGTDTLNYFCESLLYSSCSFLFSFFLLKHGWFYHYNVQREPDRGGLIFIRPRSRPNTDGPCCVKKLLIDHAITCFADNQLSQRSISFSLLKSIHRRLM